MSSAKLVSAKKAISFSVKVFLKPWIDEFFLFLFSFSLPNVQIFNQVSALFSSRVASYLSFESHPVQYVKSYDVDSILYTGEKNVGARSRRHVRLSRKLVAYKTASA